MKKGAVAGAIVWSAPLLTSTPAFAATLECGGSKPCTNWYYAKYEGNENGGGSCSSGAGGDGNNTGTNGNGCYNVLGDVGSGCAKTVTAFQDGCALLNAAGTFSHTGTTATVTFPTGAVPLYIQIKPGSNCYTYKWNGTSFDFYRGTDGATGPTAAPPATCISNPLNIPVSTTPQGRLKVDIQWNSGGACNGISHFNAYFCL